MNPKRSLRKERRKRRKMQRKEAVRKSFRLMAKSKVVHPTETLEETESVAKGEDDITFGTMDLTRSGDQEPRLF